jgi:hypothetical protein
LYKIGKIEIYSAFRNYYQKQQHINKHTMFAVESQGLSPKLQNTQEMPYPAFCASQFQEDCTRLCRLSSWQSGTMLFHLQSWVTRAFFDIKQPPLGQIKKVYLRQEKVNDEWLLGEKSIWCELVPCPIENNTNIWPSNNFPLLCPLHWILFGNPNAPRLSTINKENSTSTCRARERVERP